MTTLVWSIVNKQAWEAINSGYSSNHDWYPISEYHNSKLAIHKKIIIYGVFLYSRNTNILTILGISGYVPTFMFWWYIHFLQSKFIGYIRYMFWVYFFTDDVSLGHLLIWIWYQFLGPTLLLNKFRNLLDPFWVLRICIMVTNSSILTFI